MSLLVEKIDLVVDCCGDLRVHRGFFCRGGV